MSEVKTYRIEKCCNGECRYIELKCTLEEAVAHFCSMIQDGMDLFELSQIVYHVPKEQEVAKILLKKGKFSSEAYPCIGKYDITKK